MSSRCDSQLSMQVCQSCGRVQYPAREICRQCLSDNLAVRDVSAFGRALTAARLHISLAPEPDQILPLTLATIELECGVTAITFADPDVIPGCQVCLSHIDNKLVAERNKEHEEEA